MQPDHVIKVSRYLSKHLRHQPDRLGLTLAPGGWVEIDTLLAACAAHNFPISRADLETVVSENDKQRFSIDSTGTRIRANQGHSVQVDLQLEPQVPPDLLYHGTGEQSIAAILETGLQKMRRHHVHLSQDIQTAIRVGRRHGRPAVLAIDAAAMHGDEHLFYCSDNQVWLVDQVPPNYLKRIEIGNDR